MDKAQRLSDLQYAIMSAVWRLGKATSAQIRAELTRARPDLCRDWKASTMATHLSRLEKRGFLGHRARGRYYVYRARIAPCDVRRAMVKALTDLVFDGDSKALVSYLYDENELTLRDLDDVRLERTAASAPE